MNHQFEERPEEPDQQQQQGKEVKVETNTTTSTSSTSSTTHAPIMMIKPREVLSMSENSDVYLKVKDSSNDMINKMLSAKLNQLSIEERTQGLDELHGVADDVPETFESLVQSLQEIDQAIKVLLLIEADNKNNDSSESSESSSEQTTFAYQKAIQKNDVYVERIKIFCLRADNYNSQKAAARCVSFFQFKLRLFGINKLGREIIHTDMEEEDMAALRNGGLQLLQNKDQSGRAIIVMVGSIAKDYSIPVLSRIYYYMNMVAMRDEITQKKGVVFIFYSVGNRTVYPGRAENLARVMWLMPVKNCAAHYCYDDPRMEIFHQTWSTALESYYLCRFRAHYGTHDECAYKLSTFGIPNIIMKNGQFDYQWIRRLIDITKEQENVQYGNNNQKKKNERSLIKTTTDDNDDDNNNNNNNPTTSETSSSSSLTVEEKNQHQQHQQQSDNNKTTSQQVQQQPVFFPGPLDLMVRKGRYSKDSEGNQRYKGILERRLEEYEKAGYGEKRILADAVLQELRQFGCRFLKRSNDGGDYLVECDDDESRNKITHAFRTMRGQKQQRTKKEMKEKKK